MRIHKSNQLFNTAPEGTMLLHKSAPFKDHVHDNVFVSTVTLNVEHRALHSLNQEEVVPKSIVNIRFGEGGNPKP